MALWDKLRTELDRAGRVAQGALDEGKTRLDVFRARQRADRAAQALGYAVFRARKDGRTSDEATITRLYDAVAARDAEVAQLEERIRAAQHEGRATPPQPPPPPSPPPPPNPPGG